MFNDELNNPYLNSKNMSYKNNKNDCDSKMKFFLSEVHPSTPTKNTKFPCKVCNSVLSLDTTNFFLFIPFTSRPYDSFDTIIIERIMNQFKS